MNTRFSRRSALALAAATLAVGTVARADVEPALRTGSWDGSVRVSEVDVPFRFELRIAAGKVEGAFFNGDERVSSTAGSLQDNHLTLDFAHYASRLDAQWSGGKLVGQYLRTGQAPYPFQAQPHVAAARNAVKAPSIAGQWQIAVKSPKGEDAWRFFVRQAGNEVSAAILRVDGDTGTLSGRFADGKFVLSHFSGARPNLLEVTPNSDGSLTLVQNRSTTYSAVRSTAARDQKLPEPADPSRWTSVRDPSQPLHFAGKDLDGNEVTQADARFVHKVLLLNVMGSWCPNCHDEAPFLERLYKKYHKRGLEIVALSFEDAEQLKEPTRLRAFVKTYGVEYTVLRAGEPKEVAAKLPDAVNLNTWPATFFIGRDGLVRGAHAGFAGKATGDVNKQLEAELTRTVEKLLAEK